jgi:hypothetical protein
VVDELVADVFAGDPAALLMAFGAITLGAVVLAALVVGWRRPPRPALVAPAPVRRRRVPPSEPFVLPEFDETAVVRRREDPTCLIPWMSDATERIPQQRGGSR